VRNSHCLNGSTHPHLRFRSIIDLIIAKKISGAIGKQVLEEMFKIGDTQDESGSPGVLADEIVTKKGWELMNNSGDVEVLEEYCKQVVANNPQDVEKYLKGKLGVKQFLVGQVMKMSKGKARPEQIQEILDKYLK